MDNNFLDDFNKKHYLQLIMDCESEEAKQYMTNSVPDTLIKFYSLQDENGCCKNQILNNRKLNTLIDGNLYLSDADKMNDPFEYEGVYIDYKSIEHNAPQYLEMVKIFDYLIKEIHKLTSFCDKSANTPAMWAYYTNNHQGFYIEYKINNKRLFNRVLYENERSHIWKTVISLLSQDKKEENFLKPEIMQVMDLIRHRFFIKHDSWEHEKEFRLVTDCKNQKNKNIYSFKEMDVKPIKVVCGLKCSDKNIKKLKKFASKFNIPIYKTKMSENDFSLVEIEIKQQ